MLKNPAVQIKVSGLQSLLMIGGENYLMRFITD